MPSLDQIWGLVAGYPMAALLLYLWWDERQARKRSERRYRATLRELADLSDEDISNGDGE